MRRIAVINLKGGAGKTTSAVSLAGVWASQGHRVLLHDLDPQASASSWCARELAPESERGAAAAAVFAEDTDLAQIIVPTTIPGVDMIPSAPALNTAETEITRKVYQERILTEKVGKLPPNWDLYVIDCGPAMDFLTLSALIACEAILIPVEAGAMAMEGLVRVLALIEEIQAAEAALGKRGPQVAGILLCKADRRTNLSGDIRELLRSEFPEWLLNEEIPVSVRLAEAPSHRESITQYAPSSPGAKAYERAAAEILQRLEQWRAA